jgi:hypothetical protein
LGDFSGAGGTAGAGTLEVAGTLSPGNSPASVSFGGDLALLDGYVPPNGTSFVVVQAAGLAGELAGLPDGELVANVDGADFFIHYGPQEVLLTVPEPDGTLLLAAGIPLLWMLTRRRVSP